MQGDSSDANNKNLVLIINGWGMPNFVIAPLQQLFFNENIAAEVINLVDIPLITSANTALINYQAFFVSLTQKLANKNVHIIAWSMGGNIASTLAEKFYHQVKSLTFISSNPCFVVNSNWQTAMPIDIFTKFKHKFKINANMALMQFTNLCTLGNNKQKLQSLKIRQGLSYNQSQINQLELLLNILAKLDTRDLLSNFKKPVLHFFGTNDALVPIAIMQQINKLYPEHKTIEFKSGHSFFLDDFNPVFQKIYHFHQHSS